MCVCRYDATCVPLATPFVVCARPLYNSRLFLFSWREPPPPPLWPGRVVLFFFASFFFTRTIPVAVCVQNDFEFVSYFCIAVGNRDLYTFTYWNRTYSARQLSTLSFSKCGRSRNSEFANAERRSSVRNF